MPKNSGHDLYIGWMFFELQPCWFCSFLHRGSLFYTRSLVVDPALIACNDSLKKIFTFSNVTDEEFETCLYGRLQVLGGEIS